LRDEKNIFGGFWLKKIRKEIAVFGRNVQYNFFLKHALNSGTQVLIISDTKRNTEVDTLQCKSYIHVKWF